MDRTVEPGAALLAEMYRSKGHASGVVSEILLSPSTKQGALPLVLHSLRNPMLRTAAPNCSRRVPVNVKLVVAYECKFMRPF